MTRPVLVCQGFQRAFFDAGGPMFSVSATVRRNVCEQALKRARTAGWAVVHSFLDTDTLGATGGVSMDGFAPSPAEAYFRQRSLSAFRNPGFHAKLESIADRSVFLISLAGLSVIAATFLDGLERRIPIRIVTDAVADIAHCGVDERERLETIEMLARAHGREASSCDIGTAALPPRPSTRKQLFADGVL
jgi:nicotinamidase-related amidase